MSRKYGAAAILIIWLAAKYQDMRNRIRDVRKKVGFTQVDLADIVSRLPGGEKIDQSTLSKIESGKRNPSIMMLFRIAEALGRPVADLLADEDNLGRLRNENEAAILELFRQLTSENQTRIMSRLAMAVRAQEGTLTEAEWLPQGILDSPAPELPAGNKRRDNRRRPAASTESAE